MTTLISNPNDLTPDTAWRDTVWAWTPEEALRRLFEWKGHLDQPLLAEFARCLGYEDTIPKELADGPAGPSPARAVNGYSDPRPAGA